MLFLFIFLHFLSTGHAESGHQCDFTANSDTGCASVTGKTMNCITRGGQKIASADYASTGCAKEAPFKSCICQNVGIRKVAGTLLSKDDVVNQVCNSEVAYRLVNSVNTKLAIMDEVLGTDPGVTTISFSQWTAGVIGTAIAGTSARCGIPAGEFCIVTTTTNGTNPDNLTDDCMPGLRCYTGFGEGTKAGICTDDETTSTENAWLLKFRTDTLARIADNEALLQLNKTAIAANNTAIAANLTAVKLADKTNTDWFRGEINPNDDVPDFKERGKLLLTVTVFVGIFVLPGVLYLVWKQCSQPARKQSRRSVKAADSDELSDES